MKIKKLVENKSLMISKFTLTKVVSGRQGNRNITYGKRQQMASIKVLR